MRGIDPEVLKASLRSEDTSPEEKALARVWLHFPDTRPSNVLGRAAAFEKRRAKAKRAKATRKRNRRAAK